MSQSASVGLVIVLAVLAANFPFVTQRFLGVLNLKQPKILAVRLAELVMLYLVVGGVGLLLENKAGQASFKATRAIGDAHPIEEVGAKLRAMMPWIAKNKLVDKTRN